MKLPTLQQGLRIFFETIHYGITHQDYDRTVALAKDYTTYTTGMDFKHKLKRFNMRETEEMFNQRVKLTQPITPDICNSILNPMMKVGRTPAAIDIKWEKTEDDEKKLKELLDVVGQFYGDQSVDDYLSYRMAELDGTDCNAFIVVEFKENVDPTDKDTKALPYPFEVFSDNAINYNYANNILQFLITKHKQSRRNDKGLLCEDDRFTIYLENNSATAQEIHKDNIKNWMTSNDYEMLDFDFEDDFTFVDGVNYLFVTPEEEEDKRRYFVVKIYTHNIGYVPAKRVASKRDLTTLGRTGVPIMHPAQPYLEKSIKVMSEFDLTNCLHVFPQKIQYSRECQGYYKEDGEDRVHIPCNNGYSLGGVGVCHSCKGSGFDYHSSSQDMITFRMPKDMKDMANLENALVYKHPPIDLLEFQKKLGLYELRHAAQRAVYNSDVFSKDEIAVTATEKNIDLDAVYDTLAPFARNYSAMWVFIYKTIAIIRDLAPPQGKGITITHKFPTDFKMKPLSTLLADLKLATENLAPSYVKKAIIKDIARRLYIDNPDEMRKIDVKDKFYPFVGKDTNDINHILSEDITTAVLKVFWANFDQIFSELEYEQSIKEINFYQLAETAQRTLIKKKIEEYAKAIDDEGFENAQTGFSDAQPDIPGQGATTTPARTTVGNNATLKLDETVE